ncbi:MAG: D-aminoacyl-tRNA deacylase [Bacteroidota bacterium]
MRALIQRVSSASVLIDGKIHGQIGPGMLILLGVKTGDTEADGKYLAEKCAALRVFEDQEEKMNLSVREINGSVLVVSQFTLYGDTRKGNRPSFTDAAPPQIAEQLYENFVSHLRTLLGPEKVATGAFRAMMEVSLVNNGPVTVIVESKERQTSVTN